MFRSISKGSASVINKFVGGTKSHIFTCSIVSKSSFAPFFINFRNMSDTPVEVNPVTTVGEDQVMPEGAVLGPDGKPLSKNQLKKLAKGKPISRTETEEKPVPVKKEKPASDIPKKEKKTVEAYEYVNTTPEGEKKDLSGEMLASYHPQAVEAAWESWWQKSGFTSCDPAKAAAAGEDGRFVMVMPPPNVTGTLHLGHTLTNAIQDSLARWHRMEGRPTLWLPGLDHAGIATQTVVEKRLQKERGITRHDLGREKFLEEVWKWKETYGGKINQQQRKLGISVDWSREKFTMDESLSVAVKEAFVRLHSQGLIYRDNRLVNWCCMLRSAISDIEVEYIELEGRTKLPVPGHNPNMKYEFGCLTSFAYKVADSESGEEIVVATTRIETMLGDAAVAVHPNDPRYSHLHGKFVVHPFDGRKIPIICDSELVDMSFGTGAVKITPAHDPNDFICGKKHNLPFITMLDDEGKINSVGGERFAGMMRYDARYAVTKALEEMGLLRGKADNKMRLGVCSRTGDIIEPMIKPQWYVSCAEMGARAAASVRNGELQIVPEIHKAVWYYWMDSIKDWCISRQLWWGHRIPAYLVLVDGAVVGGDSTDQNNWVVARSEEEAVSIAAKRFNVPESSITLQQDPDVLDTWFSSGLFPFSSFGWPNEDSLEFKAFYPNAILETGHDIIFFWVARMVMLGQQLTGKLPFKTVYLHAMVRDKYGRKMSKSLGNVIDPLEVIKGCSLEELHEKVRQGNLPAKEVETAIKGQKLDYPDGIPECGTDALRFGLLAYSLQGRDINLDISRVVAYRQFCNKLWNLTKFALTHLSADRYTPLPLYESLALLSTSTRLSTRDRWILSRLNTTVAAVSSNMGSYAFASAAQAVYDFFLYDLCDYYLELLKPLLSGGEAAAAAECVAAGGSLEEAQTLARTTLHMCLELGFRAMHPMMPFVTEELWQHLPGRGQPLDAAGTPDWPSIMISSFPKPIENRTDKVVEDEFEQFQAVVKAIRGLRSDADIANKPATTFLAVPDADLKAVLQRMACDVSTLTKSSVLNIVDNENMVEEGCSANIINEKVSAHLLLKGLIDPAVEAAKLKKKVEKISKDLDILTKKELQPGYEEKVPLAVREANTELIASNRKQVEMFNALIAKYNSWSQ